MNFCIVILTIKRGKHILYFYQFLEIFCICVEPDAFLGEEEPTYFFA